MTEPAKLHTVPQVAESLVDRSRRLNAEATEAARRALGEALATTEALQTEWAALASLTTLDGGLREEARQMAAELSNRAVRVTAILRRLGQW